MFFSWRYQLSKADDAFRQGRLEESARALGEGNLLQYRQGQLLATKVAEAMALRARKYLVGGDAAAGWRVVETASKLLGNSKPLLHVRRQLVDHQLNEAEDALSAEDLTGALLKLQRLQRHRVNEEPLRRLKLVVQRVESARNLSLRGKFTDAEMQLAAAAELRPDLEVLGRLRTSCREKQQQSRGLTEELHRALAEQDWSRTATLSDELLQLAPECSLARDAKRKAWARAGTPVLDSPRIAQAEYWSGQSGEVLATCLSEVESVTKNGSANRFLLWVDAVGGYMVCLQDELTLGQAIPNAGVDVPLLGDLSRRHAKIRREGEGYVLEPLADVRIEGKEITEPTLLNDGEEIELGGSVRLRFRKPHALSATARLDFVSRHRTQPWADGVLLMAESCVLGPNWHNHVVCRDWPGDVVLYRDEAQLCCRAMDEIEIDGHLCDGQGPITANSRIAGVDFSMSLEEI